MASQTRKINKKLLASIAIIIIVVSIAAVAAEYMLSQPHPTTELPTMSLKLIGSDNQQKNLTQQDIAALEPDVAQGGFKTSGGAISGVGTYTGVPVTELLDLIGGMTSDQTLTVTASDGYTMDFSYNQTINGQDFPTYDPATGSAVNPTQPMKLVLTYYINGAALASDEGPLRLGVLGPEGLLTQGLFWVKLVTQLQVNPSITPSSSPTPAPASSPTPSPSQSPSPTPTAAPASWNVIINGTTAVTMTKTQFESEASSNTQTYTDSGTTWSGTSLYRLVVWATNNGAISSSALTSGYVVKVIGTDGSIKAFNDTRTSNNANIIIANQSNGAALTGGNFPLTLAGSELTGKEKIKGITQIQIIPIPHIQLTLVASNGTQITLFSNDLIELAAYSANGGTRSGGGTLANYGTYTGVPILTLCNLVGGVTSSNTVKVTGSDTYTVTYSYAQVNGQGISTYNDTGTSVTPTQPLTMIVAYYCNSTALTPDIGPLRTITVGPEGYYTTGNLSARLAVKIEIL